MSIDSLSKDQAKALKTFKDWWESLLNGGTGRKFFKLGGLAGTGKTYLLQFLLSTIGLEPEEVVWGAYTGKAALVMNRKGIPATTIHRMMYMLDEDEKKKGKLIFVKRDKLREGTRLVIIDEASMVSEEIHRDLLSFETPILYVGDYFQLPPVEGDFNLMTERGLDAKLSEIQRQALDSPIIKWSLWVREGKRLPFINDKGIVSHIDYDDLKISSMKAASQIITGKNKTRTRINMLMREEFGYEGDFPNVREKLIITRNNYPLGVINGQQIRVVSEAEKNNFLSFKMRFVNEYDYDAWLEHEKNKPATDSGKANVGAPKLESIEDFYSLSLLDLEGLDLNPYERQNNFSRRNYEDTDYKISQDEMKEYIQSDYGYCITCHKAQGSEWDNLLVIDDGLGRGEIRQRWLYTALTRASKRLILADCF